MGFAAVNLFIGAAKGTEGLKTLHYPESKTGLFAPRALANDTMGAAVGESLSSFT
jgi:hypothetical protein